MCRVELLSFFLFHLSYFACFVCLCYHVVNKVEYIIQKLSENVAPSPVLPPEGGRGVFYTGSKFVKLYASDSKPSASALYSAVEMMSRTKPETLQKH